MTPKELVELAKNLKFVSNRAYADMRSHMMIDFVPWHELAECERYEYCLMAYHLSNMYDLLNGPATPDSKQLRGKPKPMPEFSVCREHF